MVEKLAISEGVCNHISDREAMLSKMNWSKLIIIHVRVAKIQSTTAENGRFSRGKRLQRSPI